MKSIKLMTLLGLFFLISCSQSQEKTTNPGDYNHYLEVDNNSLKKVIADNEFWLNKVKNSPSQYPYLSKLAGTYNQLFKTTGKIEYLLLAEQSLVEVNEITKYKKPGYLKSLASNYISQHRFRESLALLEKCEDTGEKLQSTYKMLFDVYLELGATAKAKNYLTKIEKDNDFDYLIRFSKWQDQIGDLDKAIFYLEKATRIAESSKMKNITQWAYTNLADYYGHHGDIQDSYTFYLKSLKLDPNDTYALKGIAWIIYSHERNPDEALRILDAISISNLSPDYHLLKAEIAEYKLDFELKNKEMALFGEAMKNSAYGDMYNKYNVVINLEKENKNIDKAMSLSKTEISNRPTAQSYDLMAWTLFIDGKYEDALQIVEKHIADKTFEPETLYHVAEIYKANGQFEKIKPIKTDLIASIYELGPLMEKRIQNL